jgi:hypothetical protein
MARKKSMLGQLVGEYRKSAEAKRKAEAQAQRQTEAEQRRQVRAYEA